MVLLLSLVAAVGVLRGHWLTQSRARGGAPTLSAPVLQDWPVGNEGSHAASREKYNGYQGWREPRVASFDSSYDAVCPETAPGSCNGQVCSVSKEDFDSMDWSSTAEYRSVKALSLYNEGAAEYSVPMAKWKVEDDEPRELVKVNLLLYSTPDGSLCSNSLCRMGPLRDGGGFVCIDENHLQKEECVVYSIGVNHQPFVSVTSASLGCEIHVFDTAGNPENEQVPKSTDNNVHFHSLGVSPQTYGAASLLSLQHVMETHQHEHIDVLRLDCEGCEWSVFESLADSFPYLLRKVSQLIIKVNLHPTAGIQDLKPVVTFVDHVFWNHGFRIAYRQMTPRAAYFGHRYKDMIENQTSLKGQPPVIDFPYWELVLLRQR